MDNDDKPTANTNGELDERKASPLEVLDQVHCDFAVAMDVIDHHHHQQNAAALVGSSIEEEEEEGEWSSSSDDEDDEEEADNDYEFFDSQGVEEVEDDYDDDDDDDEMEEDDIDPDEMTYEELMALGELIGPGEKIGLSMEEILGPGCLRLGRKFDELLAEVDRCVICQAEFEEEGGGGGDDEQEELAEIVGCGHPYHVGCITNWLLVKKSCPICGYEVSPGSSPPSNVKEPCT